MPSHNVNFIIISTSNKHFLLSSQQFRFVKVLTPEGHFLVKAF